MGLRVSTLGLVLTLAAAAPACTPAKAGGGGSRGSSTPSRVVGGTAGAATQMGCGCLAVAGEVSASIIADVADADLLYVRGDFQGALDLYAKAYGVSPDPVLLYAQGMAKWQLGALADAKALLQQYIAVGGSFTARAEVAVRDIDDGVAAAVAAGVGAGAAAGGALVGGVGGAVGGLADVGAKPVRVAGTAGIILGVVAVAAIGAVGIHAIAAGLKDDVSLDAKFDLGLGLTGVVVGATGIYVYGLTAASAAVAAACSARIVSTPRKRPLVAPILVPGGGGIGAVVSF